MKYYYDVNSSEEWKIFSSLNDEKIPFEASNDPEIITKNDNAQKFYKEANKFKNRITNGDLKVLLDLSTKDAIDAYGIFYKDYDSGTSPYSKDIKIFAELANTDKDFIEDENSNFNMHRKEVIKNSIESNLMVAIANYNKVSTSDVKFAMPRLKDEEWDELTTLSSIFP